VSGDVQARFCEGPRGQFPRSTHRVVLCRQDVQEPLKGVRQVLARLGLSLNEAKTQVVDAKSNHTRVAQKRTP
jgi:hypothetical protein